MKRLIPWLLTFIAGTAMIADYFIPHRAFGTVTAEMKQWGLIVVAFSYILGVVNVVRIQGKKISRRDPDWMFSVVLVVSLFTMAGLGIFHRHQGEGTPFIWLFDTMYDPLASTMFALLAFFITSAAYRAFRARSTQAVLLLSAAILVMLGQVPVGAAIWGEEALLGGFPGIKDWIMAVPNLAGKRAILMGAALGAISTGLRIILGLERAHLGGGN
jgi:hypothetical protein